MNRCKMFHLLEQFTESEGHCNIPNQPKENSKNLGRWLARKKTLEK